MNHIATMAFLVGRRTREIGVRMALGARDATVATMVVREALGVVGIGLVIGVGGALALTRVLASLLYEVSPTDPLTFIGVAVVLGAVALTASYLPARRAARVDPIVALRTAGVHVGLGVDGSSSADSASLWLEARHAMLLADAGPPRKKRRRRRRGKKAAEGAPPPA